MEYYLIFLVMSFVLLGAMYMYWGVYKKAPTSARRNYYLPYNGGFKFSEILIVAIISLLLPIGVISGGMFSQVADTEIWNGKVTSKVRDKVSCRHSYQCNCRTTGSGKNQSTTCDTCYEHSYDIDWDVHSTVGTYSIATLDRQGLREPPRWTATAVGDPASKTHTFVNYIKGAKHNVLNREGTKISYAMPVYPANVFDYYKINRAVSVDNAMPNLTVWSDQISLALRDLGPSKQLNIVMVFTKNPEVYADQLNAAWLGGKKNDVIIVIGTTDHVKADWIKVLSWSKREDFKIDIREALIGVDLVAAPVMQVIATTLNKSFERRHMAEFDYLKYDIAPPFGFLIAAFFVFFIPLGVYIWMKRK